MATSRAPSTRRHGRVPAAGILTSPPRSVESPPAGLAAAPCVHLDEVGLQVGARGAVLVEVVAHPPAVAAELPVRVLVTHPALHQRLEVGEVAGVDQPDQRLDPTVE